MPTIAVSNFIKYSVVKTRPLTTKQREQVVERLKQLVPNSWRIEGLSSPVLIESPEQCDRIVYSGDWIVHVGSQPDRPQGGRYVRLLVNDGNGSRGWKVSGLWGPHTGRGCVDALVLDAARAMKLGEQIHSLHHQLREHRNLLILARRGLRNGYGRVSKLPDP